MTRPPDGSAVTRPARPATKGIISQRVDPALMRRTIDVICAQSAAAGQPIRRKAARGIVAGHLDSGRTPADILRGARNELGIVDETGQTAAHRLDRARWAPKAQRLARRRGEAVND